MKATSVLFAAAAMSATLLTFGLTAAPAGAQTVEEVVVTARSDVPTAIVYYDDLNLASQIGRSRLVRRIDFAADKLCGKRSTQDVGSFHRILTCHAGVVASAEPQMKAAIAAFERGEQLALGDVQAMTLSAQ